MNTDPIRGFVEEAARGERAAIEALLVRHLPALRAYIRLSAGPAVRARESCSDLVQSVCREVLQDLSGFEYRGEDAFRRWLFTAALRKIVDRSRRAAVREAVIAREAAPADAEDGERSLERSYANLLSPSGVALAREETARIEAAFDELSDEHREVIVMARVLGLSFSDIAAQTGRSENAVQKLLARGLARLHTLVSSKRGS